MLSTNVKPTTNGWKVNGENSTIYNNRTSILEVPIARRESYAGYTSDVGTYNNIK